MRALHLTAPAVQLARQIPELKGKKPIGRGVFTAVFDGTRPDTVLKLTVDSRAYGLLNDGVYFCGGPHFPKVTRNFGDMGDVEIAEQSYTIFLYEVERLERLRGGTLASKQAHLLTKMASAASGRAYAAHDDEYAAPTVAHMVEMAKANPLMGAELVDALDQLRVWTNNNDEVGIDIHRSNLMADKDGRLVINDPVCHQELLNRIQNRWAVMPT